MRGLEKRSRLSCMMRPNRTRSSLPMDRMRPRRQFMAGLSQRKLTTTRSGAVMPLADRAWNSPGGWKTI